MATVGDDEIGTDPNKLRSIPAIDSVAFIFVTRQPDCQISQLLHLVDPNKTLAKTKDLCTL